MFRTLVYLLIAVVILGAIAEAYLFLLLGHQLGMGWTMTWVFGTFFVGMFLMYWQGLRILYLIHQKLQAEILPVAESVDLSLVVMAGLFLMAPGFLTDTLGLLLFIPPVRAIVRRFLTVFMRYMLADWRPHIYSSQTFFPQGLEDKEASNNGWQVRTAGWMAPLTGRRKTNHKRHHAHGNNPGNGHDKMPEAMAVPLRHKSMILPPEEAAPEAAVAETAPTATPVPVEPKPRAKRSPKTRATPKAAQPEPGTPPKRNNRPRSKSQPPVSG